MTNKTKEAYIGIRMPMTPNNLVVRGESRPVKYLLESNYADGSFQDLDEIWVNRVDAFGRKVGYSIKSRERFMEDTKHRGFRFGKRAAIDLAYGLIAKIGEQRAEEMELPLRDKTQEDVAKLKEKMQEYQPGFSF